jgi:hypothetical protein
MAFTEGCVDKVKEFGFWMIDIEVRNFSGIHDRTSADGEESVSA